MYYYYIFYRCSDGRTGVAVRVNRHFTTRTTVMDQHNRLRVSFDVPWTAILRDHLNVVDALFRRFSPIRRPRLGWVRTEVRGSGAERLFRR